MTKRPHIGDLRQEECAGLARAGMNSVSFSRGVSLARALLRLIASDGLCRSHDAERSITGCDLGLK